MTGNAKLCKCKHNLEVYNAVMLYKFIADLSAVGVLQLKPFI